MPLMRMEIVVKIPGTFDGSRTSNEYFLMVPVEDTSRFDSRYPVSATIKAGAKDDDLINALIKGSRHVIINEACPRDA